MTQIATIDYPNLDIYLHIDTVTAGFSPLLMQQEERTLRRTTEQFRKYDPMSSFIGLENKGGGALTPPSTRLRSGVRIIPYDTGAGNQYQLLILDEILNIPDGLSNRTVFDRTSVGGNIDVDIAYSPIEVKTVNTGSGVLPADVTDIKNAIFNETMETGFDFRDFQLIMAAALGGKASGMSGTSGVFRSVDDAKNRISVTMDEFGNRTAITFDLT